MKTLLLMTIFFAAPTVQAASLPEMTAYFSQSLQATDTAVNTCQAAPPPAQVWFLRRFWLRIKPTATFSIPLIAKISISPELEMLWQRDLQ